MALVKVYGVDLGAIKHLVKMIYHYLFLCHAWHSYAVGYLFFLLLFWISLKFFLSHLRADRCSQAHAFFSILLFPDLYVPFCHTFLGIVCCFSGPKFGFISFLTPCTSMSLVLLVLACECICIRNFPSFLHTSIFLFSSKILYALKEIGIISLRSLSSFFCHERKSLRIISLTFL